MLANSFAAIRPYGAEVRANHAGEWRANHAGEFIRRYSPYARGNANVTRAPRPSPSLCTVKVPL